MSDFPRLLKEAGILLYGQDWKTALADDLGVDRSTIIRWSIGAFKPTDHRFIVNELRWLLKRHGEACMDIHKAFERLK